jgi:predicted component of type VI protein secretion system
VSKPDLLGLVQEVVTEIGPILKQIEEVLENHENRLQLTESAELKAELTKLQCRIKGIPNLEKQAQALAALKGLSDLLNAAELVE